MENMYKVYFKPYKPVLLFFQDENIPVFAEIK